MTFGRAIDAVLAGHLAARSCWPMGTWIALVKPDDGDKINGRCVVIDKPSPPEAYPGGVRQPYTPPHDDLVADDWAVIE